MNPRLVKISNFTIHVSKCNPLRAGTYIDLPNFIKSRRAVINVKNTDNFCFLWCLLRKFHQNHPLVKTNINFTSEIKQKRAIAIFNEKFKNLGKFESFMPFKSVPKFERENQISINVFTIAEKFYHY